MFSLDTIAVLCLSCAQPAAHRIEKTTAMIGKIKHTADQNRLWAEIKANIESLSTSKPISLYKAYQNIGQWIFAYGNIPSHAYLFCRGNVELFIKYYDSSRQFTLQFWDWREENGLIETIELGKPLKADPICSNTQFPDIPDLYRILLKNSAIKKIVCKLLWDARMCENDSVESPYNEFNWPDFYLGKMRKNLQMS